MAFETGKFVTSAINAEWGRSGSFSLWADGNYLDADGKPIMQTLTQADYDLITPNDSTVYFIV